MGNANTKLPPSPANTMQKPQKLPGGMIQDLQEDITCPICLGPFVDPVSIDCGHNFCRGCLSHYWRGFLPHGYRCPQCRQPCSRDRIKSDTRLRNLVEKIRQLPVQEIQKELKMPTSLLPSGQPVQLLSLNENGVLCLQEEVLSHCLEQEQVKDCPVCLVSILGEHRRGKSFLLNFLLRRLRNLEIEGASWMGEEAEPLKGFEWRPGPRSTTKGVWIWSQPFWIPSEQGKVAMFLMDTEGSLDLERSKEVSIKLSAFSMLLSSYLILNVATMMKDSDLEYLETFVYVAETVGRTCKLKPIQRLDVVVRDWYFPAVFRYQGGQACLQDTIQKLKGPPGRHPRALEALRSRNTHCYLMPFPGKSLVMGTRGTLADMDYDFRDCLREYVDGLARSAGNHVRRDQEGKALTGAELADRIKNFSDILKKHKFHFSSATEMAINLRNWEIQEMFEEFIKEQDQLTLPMLKCLKVTPKSMAQRLKHELERRCNESLEGDGSASKEELKSLLQSSAKDFLDRYGRRYTSHALKAGLAIGVGTVGLAGGAIGAGVAGAILAAEAAVLGTEAVFAIGTMAGAGTFALAGGGIGARLGHCFGKRKTQDAQNGVRNDEQEEDEDLSDEKCLIGQQDGR
ncbi:RING finger protein 112 isoform X2 [Tiliqua scincoides]|uniref:RING finger protein 112 isoform X2 n=1 Tax=Tiliqua scincoides TaxID=71010 RepID=UPI00346241ED